MKVITPNWNAPASIKACTTVRDSWGAAETQSTDPTLRASLVSALSLPEYPIWLKQTHSTIALPATAENQDREADASYTSETNRVCLVLTADCLPLLVCNQQGTEVAAIHAGWRGLAGGVIENTIRAMRSSPEDLMVWMGPAIGPQKFEVGRDVVEAFAQHNPASKIHFTSCGQDKWLANLYQLAAMRLHDIGVNNIHGGDYCTHTQKDLFFSYRRDKHTVGRMASVIWIAPKT